MSRGSEYASITALVGTETVIVTDNPGVAGGTKKMTTLIMAQQLAALALWTPPTAWTAPTFTNSWVNFGGTVQVAQYRKEGDVVRLRGAIKTGAVPSSPFTLPVGFRPLADLGFPVVSNGAFGWVAITSAGVVTVTIGSTTRVDLNTIAFSTV